MATISPKKRSLDLPQDPSLQRKTQRSRLIVMNYYTAGIVLFFFISTTCFLYITQFNDISSQGVIINMLESQRSELIIENEVWNMRIAQLKSLDVIEHQDVVNRMPLVDPAEIEFIDLDKRSDLSPLQSD